jgi:transposase
MDSPRSFGIIVSAGVIWCECQRNQEESEMNATTVAVDLAKNAFQLAYADANWKVISTSRLTRSQFQRCFHNSSVSLIIMEACGCAHYWARQLQTLGIEVRLLPPRYIRAYVKRNKTDAADAAALLEAARCADIQPVRIKSVAMDEHPHCTDQCPARILSRVRHRYRARRSARLGADRSHSGGPGLIGPDTAAPGDAFDHR